MTDDRLQDIEMRIAQARQKNASTGAVDYSDTPPRGRYREDSWWAFRYAAVAFLVVGAASLMQPNWRNTPGADAIAANCYFAVGSDIACRLTDAGGSTVINVPSSQLARVVAEHFARGGDGLETAPSEVSGRCLVSGKKAWCMIDAEPTSEALAEAWLESLGISS